MKNNVQLISKFKCIILGVMPILGFYHFLPGISFGFFILLIFIPFDFLFNNSFKLSHGKILFFLSFIIINSIAYDFNVLHVNYDSFINNILYLFFFMIIYTYYTSTKLDYVFFKKTLFFLGIISTLIVFIQTFFILFKGEGVSFLLPLSTDLGSENLDSIQLNLRPNSVFQEPSHYAIFMLPLFYTALKEAKFFLSIIFFIGILFSTSSLGIISSLVIIALFAYKNKNGRLLLSFFILLISLIYFMFADELSYFIEFNFSKLQRATTTEDNVRLLGGIGSLSKMNTIQLFLGIGFNQLANFMTLNNFYDASNYSNSFLFSFYSAGIIGFGLFLFFLKSVVKENKDKIYFAILCLVLLTDQILFNQNLLYLILIIYFMDSSYMNVNKNVLS